MNVLLDTNVVLDLLLDRQPWSASLAPIVSASVDGRIRLWVAGTTLTNVFYVARKLAGVDRAREIVGACLDSFRVASVGEAVLQTALGLGGADFEDDAQIAAAQAAAVEAIVTRDPKGFSASSVAVWTPAAFAAMLATTG